MTATESKRLIDEIRPIYDFVFCSHERRNNRCGILYVPDDAREDIQYGTVLAIGPGERRENGLRMPMTVKVGDKVLWAKHWEKPIDLSRDEKYAAVRERDIIGILRRDTDGNEVLHPLYNTIVIKEDPFEDRAGSLFLPQQVKRPLMPAMHGTVISHGPGHRFKDGHIHRLSVKVGDRVAFEAFGGENHPFGPGGSDVRLIPEEHVLAVYSL